MRTRIFEIARERGMSGADLARAMQISEANVSRVRHGLRRIGPDFISGSLKAFPDLSFYDLFILDDEREQVPA